MPRGENVVPSLQRVEMNVDWEKQVVTFSQRSDQFSIHPSTVHVPVIAIKTLFVAILQAELAGQGVSQHEQKVVTQ